MSLPPAAPTLAARDLLLVFNTQPGATLLLSPDWLIVGASDDYLAATLTQRDTLVGQHIFYAFPDNPHTPEANAVANVRASLQQVLATKEPHEMAPQHYDVPDPARPGQFVERHWQPRHTPVLDAARQVQFIIQSVQDITASRLAERLLRESRADEQLARAEAEQQRQRFYDLLMQLPAQVAVHEGPDQVFTLVNPGYQRLAPGRDLLGQPIRAAWPELVSQDILDILDRVYQTGEPFVGTELPLQLDITRTGQGEQVYLNAFFLPLRTAQGQVTGVLDFSYDVTEQVQARRRVEQLAQQAQAARQEAERQRGELERVLEQAPVAIAVYRGAAYTIELANATIARLWGRSRAQLLGKPVYEALPEAAGLGYEQLMDEVMATGVPHEVRAMASRHLRAGHLETLYWDFVYVPMPAVDGRPDGVMVVASDVTEQVRARQQVEQFNQALETRVRERTQQLEAARAETERQRTQLYHLFRQAPAAICILGGPELVFELVNPGYQALFPSRELLGRPLLDALPEIAGNRVYETFRQVYETGHSHEEQEQLIPLARPADGVLEDRYFRYVQQARFTAAGEVDGVLVFAFEITAQVRARQQAEEGERRLQLLTDALPVLIAYIDHTYTYRFVNQAYETWFHKSPADVVGQTARTLVGPAAYAQVEANLARALAGERVEWQATMPYRDDFTRYVRGSFVPDVQNGQVLGFYSLLSDVSELVEARQAAEASAGQAVALAEELSQTNAQLTRTNIDLDNFIYTASHDLRAPITNIEGLVLALREHLPTAVGQPAALTAQLLDMMQGAVERFQTTIAQLTDIARLQQAHDLPTELVAVAEMVEAVRLDLTPQLTQAAAQLTVYVAPELRVAFAPKNLRSVVYNLLSNAVKYQHPDRAPVIVLRAERRAQTLVLTVQDNGLGLDERQQDQLFGLFRRLHTHVEGTGVGLYMVKRMVENAGGTIAVQSQPGIGTTFSIHLPA
ncbi:MAG: PAS domain-containing protein [Janthinobacterium lividum]